MAKIKFDFPSFKAQESNPIWGNNEAITTAKPIWVGSGDFLDFRLGLSDNVDGPYTYEEATSGAIHTFTATGKWIKWKAIGNNYTITNIEIEVNA